MGDDLFKSSTICEEKELLKKLGEETIYSAKGHFKSCDLRRRQISHTIWICTILNIIGVIGIHSLVDKITSAVGLFGTIALLIWNEGEGKSYCAEHKKVAEKYLALHKEIRDSYFLAPTKQQIKELSKKVRELDISKKPEIPSFARKLARKAIEKNDPETHNWFLN
jgi:hypothetical protein